MHNLVPHFILKQYAAGELNGSFPATALFVDISGFSAITDAVASTADYRQLPALDAPATPERVLLAVEALAQPATGGNA